MFLSSEINPDLARREGLIPTGLLIPHAWAWEPPARTCHTPAISRANKDTWEMCTRKLHREMKPRSHSSHPHQTFISCLNSSSVEEKQSWTGNHLLPSCGDLVSFPTRFQDKMLVKGVGGGGEYTRRPKPSSPQRRTWKICTSACSRPSHVCPEIHLVLPGAWCSQRKSGYVLSLVRKG